MICLIRFYKAHTGTMSTIYLLNSYFNQSFTKTCAYATVLGACISLVLLSTVKAQSSDVKLAIASQNSINSIENESGDAQLRTYTITLSGMNDDEYLALMQYLQLFSGFDSARLLSKSPSQTLVEYVSGATTATIENNLRNSLSELGLVTYLSVNLNQINIQIIDRRNTSKLRFGEW